MDSEADFQSLLDSSDDTGLPQRGQVLSGRIVTLEPQLIVDLGLKRDGVVAREEVDKLLAEKTSLEVGQDVMVTVMEPEDKEGNLLVSIRQMRHQKDWMEAERLLASGEVWEGTVTGYNRGGLIVKFGEVQAFVPFSHVIDLPRNLSETERPARLQALVGRQMGFKVIEVDRERKRLVLSQRNAQKEYREMQKSRILDELAEGQVRTGRVTGLRDFGAFVDLGGADGLIHISELAWQRVKHPTEVLKVGQEVEVEILKVDRESKRIALSLKRRQQTPWGRVAERFQVGQVLEGTVTRVTNFGAFVDLGEGVDGLLHARQWSGPVPVREGQEVRVKILSIQPERQRIGLTLEASPPVDEEEAPDPMDFDEAMDADGPEQSTF